MWAPLVDALGKIEGGQFIALGTLLDNAADWFAWMLDGEADYIQLHAAQAADPPFQVLTWLKANQSLHYMPSLMKSLW